MKVIRQRIERGDLIVASGVWDTLSAKILEVAGFDAIWLGSFVGTASYLAEGDIGLMTPRERVEQVARLRTVTSLPIVVDGEEGWGDAPHVAYWVREFEKAGAAGIMIDDKAGVFSTPYIEGTSREVESIDVAVRRLRAAVTPEHRMIS